jgi:pSer/pThr/pTyr-binding forkhead associated (FHA) protein
MGVGLSVVATRFLKNAKEAHAALTYPLVLWEPPPSPDRAHDSSEATQTNPGTQVGVTAKPRGGEPVVFELKAGTARPPGDQGFSLGRTEDNDLFLPDGSVSRKHAVIEKDGNGYWFVTDLGSTNGTFLNDTALKSGVRTPLPPNSTLKLGSVTLTFMMPSAFVDRLRSIVQIHL